MTISTSRDRVPDPTADIVNARLRAGREERIRKLASRLPDRPGEFNTRLKALDEEWDIERTIEANAATIAFVGVALGCSPILACLASSRDRVPLSTCDPGMVSAYSRSSPPRFQDGL